MPNLSIALQKRKYPYNEDQILFQSHLTVEEQLALLLQGHSCMWLLEYRDLSGKELTRNTTRSHYVNSAKASKRGAYAANVMSLHAVAWGQCWSRSLFVLCPPCGEMHLLLTAESSLHVWTLLGTGSSRCPAFHLKSPPSCRRRLPSHGYGRKLLCWAPGFSHARCTAGGNGKNQIPPQIEWWTLD